MSAPQSRDGADLPGATVRRADQECDHARPHHEVVPRPDRRRHSCPAIRFDDPRTQSENNQVENQCRGGGPMNGKERQSDREPNCNCQGYADPQ